MDFVWIERFLVIFINQALSIFCKQIKLDGCFYLYYILLLHFFEWLHARVVIEATRWKFTPKSDSVGQVLISRHLRANKLLRLYHFHLEKFVNIGALWIVFYHLPRSIQQFNSIFVVYVVLNQTISKLAEKPLLTQITQFSQILTLNCIEKVEVSQSYGLFAGGKIVMV